MIHILIESTKHTTDKSNTRQEATSERFL